MPTTTKFKITAYTVTKTSAFPETDVAPFEAMINPEGYTINANIKYCKPNIPGQPNQAARFHASMPDKITIKPFVIDGTGTVAGKEIRPVDEQIDHLKQVTAQFIGDKHQCRVVQLEWSSFVYVARLESMNIEYTLFSASGTPLRAKVTLGFVAYKTYEEILAYAKISSPDLTHAVEVKAGDRLPLLCNRIYNSTDHIESIARFNGLTSIRDVSPGVQLLFPPLAV